MITLHCIGSMEGGGAEKQLCKIVTGLKKQGVEVHVVLLREGVNFQLLQESGATIHKINSASNYSPKILINLIKLINKINPDIIEVWQRPMEFFASLAAFIKRKPYISIERTAPPTYIYSFKGLIKYVSVLFSNALIANSKSAVTFWKNKSIFKLNTVFIPNIIQAPKSLDEGPDSKDVILCIARLSVEKNLDLVIRSFHIFSLQNDKVKLLILGEGPERKNLEKLIQELKLNDRVNLLGYKTDIYPFLRQCKLVISLSKIEGMPNTVLEAASLKKPLLLSPIVQHLDLFSAHSAYYISSESPEHIASMMNKIWLDPEPEKVGKAYNTIQVFNEETISMQYLKVYQTVLNTD
ncbi:MAG TPA: glycosyltransferase [Saprospiraceae bacterium]|nr:glycosyltransferase [Saprospiraceae bacterium]